MFKQKKDVPILVEDVFTPSQRASLNVIDRAHLRTKLEQELLTGGRQLVVHGPSGSGKSTLIDKVLRDMSISYVRFQCNSSTTFDELLADALQQLGVSRTAEVEKKGGEKFAAASNFNLLSGLFSSGVTNEISAETRSKSVPIDRSTASISLLVRAFGKAGVILLIEDFHKLKGDEKNHLAQCMKTISDASKEYPKLKIVLVAANRSARDVLYADRELAGRLGEVYVPMMSRTELFKLIEQGKSLLNVEFDPRVSSEFVALSCGRAGICHDFCLEYCLQCGVKQAYVSTRYLDKRAQTLALKRVAERNADSVSAAIQVAFKFTLAAENRSSLEAVIKSMSALTEPITISTLWERVKLDQPGYTKAELQTTVSQLESVAAGELLVYDQAGDTVSFYHPLARALVQRYLDSDQRNDIGIAALNWRANPDELRAQEKWLKENAVAQKQPAAPTAVSARDRLRIEIDRFIGWLKRKVQRSDTT